eukprot:TRINITY_DN49292_c0_g1_i1.p1 TRINITY_DN49292_c0_g1~~TRINITY_DN49292_c0_g1_i1.p1  ORF type:complete len:380 (-),score=107.27 TRINITY_DN49292_c0_g1_i1:43-1182(-)
MADFDDDDDPGLAGLSPEFQAMIGGMAGHTASFAKLLERRSKGMSKDEETKKDDEVYLESYADLAIHEDMLKDLPRVEAYRRAIDFHAAQWKEAGDVSVIDVGSGTGLLAIFAAKAGAKKVYAVEASRLAHFLPDIMKKNVPGDVVEVKECMAEALDLGTSAKVDCIVSEWMGYFLLFENMLPSVLAVRDKFLKPGGKMLPSACRLNIAPMEDNTWRPGKVDFWKSVHGIDMSPLMPLAKATACDQAQHRVVGMDSIIGPPTWILHLNLYEATEEDLRSFESNFQVAVPAGRRLDGLVSWFECEFGEAGWLLSTAPQEAPTHWRQTAFHFRQPIEGGGGITVSGKIAVTRHEEFSRGYRVTIETSAPGRKSRTERFEIR